jgi:hypothetical protein
MKNIYTLIFALLVSCISFAQVLNETFDDNSGFTTSTPFFSDGNGDYFGLAVVDDFNGDPVPTQLKAYTGFDGGFMTGMDLDGEGASLPIIIDWTGLDIDGLTDLAFSGQFAEFFDTPGDIDDADYILVQYQIDGGGYQNLIAFEGADFTGGSGTANGIFREDTNFDGEGDGTALGDAAQTFTKNIVDTGSVLDLRMSVSLNSGDEDFAVDTFSITGTAGDTTPPVITCPGDINTGNDTGICGAVVTFPDATATDDVDPNPTVTQTAGPSSGDEFPVGVTTVEFTATDAAGNSSTCSFEVTVTDLEPVDLVCPGDQTAQADANHSYEIPDYIDLGLATISDNCTPEANIAIIQTPAPGTIVGEGNVLVSIQANDDAGNGSACAFNLTVDPYLGVEDINLAQISLYPNPANTTVTVNTMVETMALYSVTGQKLVEGKSNSLDVSGLAEGVYLVKVTTVDGTVVKQLIVN